MRGVSFDQSIFCEFCETHQGKTLEELLVIVNAEVGVIDETLNSFLTLKKRRKELLMIKDFINETIKKS